jgi:hypothetical protein
MHFWKTRPARPDGFNFETTASQEAASQEAVIPRESGVSSTPRNIASITDASEYWIARFH